MLFSLVLLLPFHVFCILLFNSHYIASTPFSLFRYLDWFAITLHCMLYLRSHTVSYAIIAICLNIAHLSLRITGCLQFRSVFQRAWFESQAPFAAATARHYARLHLPPRHFVILSSSAMPFIIRRFIFFFFVLRRSLPLLSSEPPGLRISGIVVFLLSTFSSHATSWHYCSSWGFYRIKRWLHIFIVVYAAIDADISNTPSFLFLPMLFSISSASSCHMLYFDAIMIITPYYLFIYWQVRCRFILPVSLLHCRFTSPLRLHFRALHFHISRAWSFSRQPLLVFTPLITCLLSS